MLFIISIKYSLLFVSFSAILHVNSVSIFSLPSHNSRLLSQDRFINTLPPGGSGWIISGDKWVNWSTASGCSDPKGWYAREIVRPSVVIFFVPTLLLSILTPLLLPSSFVSLTYLILAVPMQSCMSSTFLMDVLNGPCYFREAKTSFGRSFAYQKNETHLSQDRCDRCNLWFITFSYLIIKSCNEQYNKWH